METPIVTGRHASVFEGELSRVAFEIDSKINAALRTAVEARKGFKVTAEIDFVPMPSDGTASFFVTVKSRYQFSPIKVESKGVLPPLSFSIDDNGDPVIPCDAQHQINFDEIEEDIDD